MHQRQSQNFESELQEAFEEIFSNILSIREKKEKRRAKNSKADSPAEKLKITRPCAEGAEENSKHGDGNCLECVMNTGKFLASRNQWRQANSKKNKGFPLAPCQKHGTPFKGRNKNRKGRTLESHLTEYGEKPNCRRSEKSAERYEHEMRAAIKEFYQNSERRELLGSGKVTEEDERSESSTQSDHREITLPGTVIRYRKVRTKHDTFHMLLAKV